MANALRLIKNHWQLLALIAVIFLVWPTPLILPLKLLVIFFHETSHALAAVLTGGQVREMSLNPQQGGHAVTVGGSPFWIISAGYIGSLLFGILAFLVAVRTGADRIATGILGFAILTITLAHMSGTFPIVFGLLTGLALIASAIFLNRAINDLILRIIGLTSIIYVPYDIFSDTLARSHVRSDARILAETIGGPTMFWGLLWLCISLICIAGCLRYGLGPTSNIRIGQKSP